MGDNLTGVDARIAGKTVQVDAQPVVVANGARGGIYVADTTSRTGNWTVIQVLADTAFDSTCVCTIDGLAASSFTFPAGTFIYGTWTTLKLGSGGKVIAYN